MYVGAQAGFFFSDRLGSAWPFLFTCVPLAFVGVYCGIRLPRRFLPFPCEPCGKWTARIHDDAALATAKCSICDAEFRVKSLDIL